VNRQPLATVFTCTVYPDIARIWYACLQRAIPDGAARYEIYHDSDMCELDGRLFPGATILEPTRSRRDFQEAYNDALTRVETPWLAFVDSDVYWVSTRLWGEILEHMADPRVAAVSCVRRSHRTSTGTFSVVMKAEIYRDVLQGVTEGFLPGNEYLDETVPYKEWKWYDTADLATDAVLRAGWEVRFLDSEARGDLVMFRNITVFRLPAEWVGVAALAEITGRYFWRGYAGNLALKRLHDRLFPDGPPYRFPILPVLVLRKLFRGAPREILWRIRLMRDQQKGAWRVWRFAGSAKQDNRI
jgi:hypothetical protein